MSNSIKIPERYDREEHKRLERPVTAVKDECSKAVVDERSAITRLIVGQYMKHFPGPLIIVDPKKPPYIFGACGHFLMNAVPGTAKTLLAKIWGPATGLSHNRVQLTSDLQAADIVGSDFVEQTEDGKKIYIPKVGPVKTNILLADEINRGNPKAQAAFIEVACEGQFSTVGIRENVFYLDPPFLMIATQNPLEHKGVFPLPEAILDRFAFETSMGDALEAKLIEIMETTDKFDKILIKQQTNQEEVEYTREFIHTHIHVDKRIRKYIAHLILAHRYRHSGSKYINDLEEELGGGRLLNDLQQYRRAGLFLQAAGKVMAFLRLRQHVTFSDINKLALDVFRVRTVLTVTAPGAIGEEIDHLGWVSKIVNKRRIDTIEKLDRGSILDINDLKDQLCLRAIKGVKELWMV